MSRMRKLFFLLMILSIFIINSIFGQQGTPADTVITNTALTISMSFTPDITNLAMETSLTVGQIYGLGEIDAPTNSFGPMFQPLRIDFYFTNNANDADNQAVLAITSFSNNVGYTGPTWTYHLEVNSVDVGTNYNIPFTQFGEGAIFHAVLVVDIPICETNSMAFATVEATTLSNAGHQAAIYTGWNGNSYGGVDSVSADIVINVLSPDMIVRIWATDNMDTITVFNGTVGLRRSKNSIYVVLADVPYDANSIYLWYAVDSTPDGAGGSGTDKNIVMHNTTGNTYKAEISESEITAGDTLRFMFEIDNIYYGTNYLYKLLDLHEQDTYETIIMQNIIGDEPAYIKIPQNLIGKEGKIALYSIAADVVKNILDGVADTQIYNWDGTDNDNIKVSTGTYFMVIDFEELKEVRKFYVR